MSFWETVIANALGGIITFTVIGLAGLILKSQIVSYLKQNAPTWWDTSKIVLKSVATTGLLASIASIIAVLMSFLG